MAAYAAGPEDHEQCTFVSACLVECVFTHTVVCEPKCAPSRVWVLQHTVVRGQVRVLALPQSLPSPPPISPQKHGDYRRVTVFVFTWALRI